MSVQAPVLEKDDMAFEEPMLPTLIAAPFAPPAVEGEAEHESPPALPAATTAWMPDERTADEMTESMFSTTVWHHVRACLVSRGWIVAVLKTWPSKRNVLKLT